MQAKEFETIKTSRQKVLQLLDYSQMVSHIQATSKLLKK
jgi:hypothetical protein